MRYFKKMCGNIKFGTYMESSCSNNLDTMCVNCPESADLMVLDTGNISDDDVTHEAQCKFKCKSRDGVFYVKTHTETADMLQMSLSVLVNYLNTKWPNSECIHTTVDSRLMCMTRNMKFVETQEVYPQIQCVPVELNCLSRNGVLVKNLNVGVMQCHCRSGFYGTYDTTNYLKLTKCESCPPFITSITGTMDRIACFCQSGFYHNDSSPNSDICLKCRHDSLSNYCPGGLDDSSAIMNSEERQNELEKKVQTRWISITLSD